MRARALSLTLLTLLVTLVTLCSAVLVAHAERHRKRARHAPAQRTRPLLLEDPRPLQASASRPNLLAVPAPEPAVVPTRTQPTTTVMVSQTRRWGLFGGGLTLFLVGWAADIGVSYGLSNPGAAKSLIPLVGPLVQMGDPWGIETPKESTGNAEIDAEIARRAGEVNQTIQTAAYAVLAVNFIIQLTGMTMAIVGATTKSTRLTYEKGPPPLGRATVQWSLLPSGTVALRF